MEKRIRINMETGQGSIIMDIKYFKCNLQKYYNNILCFILKVMHMIIPINPKTCNFLYKLKKLLQKK